MANIRKTRRSAQTKKSAAQCLSLKAAVLTVAAFALYPAYPQSRGFDSEAMSEFAAGLFERMDLDKDGVLSREEHETTHGGGFMVDYGLLDLDASGDVSRDEYLEAVRKYHPSPKGDPI